MTDEPVTLKRLRADHRHFHDDFQIHSFIIGGNAETPFGAYRQALRELDGRWHSLKALASDRATTLADIAELAERCEGRGWRWRFWRWRCPHDAERSRIKLAGKRLAIDDVDKVIVDTHDEYARFFAIASKLKRELGPLTPDRRRELELGYWRQKLTNGAIAEVMACGQLKAMTIDSFSRCDPRWLKGALEMLVDNGMMDPAYAKRVSLLTDMIATRQKTIELPAAEPHGHGLRALPAHAMEV